MTGFVTWCAIIMAVYFLGWSAGSLARIASALERTAAATAEQARLMREGKS